MIADTNAVETEAQKIYKSVFKSRIPSIAVQRFKTVSEKLNAQYSNEEVAEYYRLISRIRDLEALEFASRILKKNDLLKRKFAAMIFIAETLPENQPHFINTRSSFTKGAAGVTYGLAKTSLKLFKGICLLWRYSSAKA